MNVPVSAMNSDDAAFTSSEANRSYNNAGQYIASALEMERGKESNGWQKVRK